MSLSPQVRWQVQTLTERNTLLVGVQDVGFFCRVLAGSGSLYQAEKAGTGSGIWSADASGGTFLPLAGGVLTGKTTLNVTSGNYSLDFLDNTGHRTSYFGPGGEYYTGHSIIASGYATNDGGGQTVTINPPFPSPNDSVMVGLASDVAIALAVRSPGAVNDTSNYLFLGGAGATYGTPHFTIRMDADGSLRWGDTTTNSIGNYDLVFSRMAAKYGQFFGTATGADLAIEICNQATNGSSNTASLYLGPHSGYSGNPVAPGVQGYNSGNNAGLRLLTFDGSQNIALDLDLHGAATFLTSIKATTGFGCNGASPQTAAASGGALAAYATGVFGLDSDAHMHALYTLVANMRAALVANGIMS